MIHAIATREASIHAATGLDLCYSLTRGINYFYSTHEILIRIATIVEASINLIVVDEGFTPRTSMMSTGIDSLCHRRLHQY